MVVVEQAAEKTKQGRKEVKNRRREFYKGDTESTELAEKSTSETPGDDKESENTTDYAGLGAFEFASGAADAWVSGKRGAREARDKRLGRDFAAAGLLLARKTGECGDDSFAGDG